MTLINTLTMSRKEAKSLGLKSYDSGIPCNRGHISVRSVANGNCRKCAREAALRFRNANPEKDRQKSRDWYAANKERAVAWKRNWIAENPERYKKSRIKWRSDPSSRTREMIATAKFSSKIKNLPFSIDREWLFPKVQLGVCELTGLPFDMTPFPHGRQNPYTASIDRIVPEKGYIKENCRVILWALNAAFNSYGEEIYAAIARVYLTKHPNSGLT